MSKKFLLVLHGYHLAKQFHPLAHLCINPLARETDVYRVTRQVVLKVLKIEVAFQVTELLF